MSSSSNQFFDKNKDTQKKESRKQFAEIVNATVDRELKNILDEHRSELSKEGYSSEQIDSLLEEMKIPLQAKMLPAYKAYAKKTLIEIIKQDKNKSPETHSPTSPKVY